MGETIDFVKDLLTKYATYVNQTRANVGLDGFKAVQRRIYYTCWNIAKSKFIKTATLAGNVIAYYHPHGTASVEEAIVTMVRNKLLIGKGNWGSRCGLEEISPAASRYTEVKFNSFLKFSMDYVKYADYVKSDIDYDEPKLIPTPIPIGLIGDLVDYPQNQQGIGVGMKTFLPLFRFSDLVQLLTSIINDKKIKPIKPFYGTYFNVEGETTKLLETGNGKFIIHPQYTLENKALHLYGLTKNLQKIIEPWRDKLLVKDLSTRIKTYIIIEPKSYQRIDFKSVANQIVNKLKLNATYDSYVAVPNKKLKWVIYKLPILVWLKAQFLYYVKIREKYITEQIQKFNAQIVNFEIIKAIRPYLVQYMKQVQKPNVKEFLDQLPNKFDKEQTSQAIQKYSISKLLSVDTDTEKIKDEIKQLEKQKENITQDSLNELNQISKNMKV